MYDPALTDGHQRRKLILAIWLKQPDNEISAEQTRAATGSRAGETG
jgi:hypothetical protein